MEKVVIVVEQGHIIKCMIAFNSTTTTAVFFDILTTETSKIQSTTAFTVLDIPLYNVLWVSIEQPDFP